jgi:hypothetical protein
LTAKSTRIVERSAVADFKSKEVILRAAELAAQKVQIPVAGVANITCVNAGSEHATIALFGPGSIRVFPRLTDE